MESTLWTDIKNHPLAMGVSLIFHVLILVILSISLSHSEKPTLPQTSQVKTVQAVVVDAAVVESELNKLKQAEERSKQQEVNRKKKLEDEMQQAREQRRQEEKRLAEIKRKQQEQEKAEKEKQAKLERERKQKQEELAKLEKQQQELEKKRQAEQQRLAAIEEKRKAEEEAARKKKEAEEAEARRLAEEAELKRRMEEEEKRLAQQNARLQSVRAQYVRMIAQHVEKSWSQPANMTAGSSCEVLVEQNPMGDVIQVQMLKCSGNDAFRDSVERAVRKASPLPSAPEAGVFEKKIQFTFRPQS
ncbi:MAG: cell envelope integrity protein TolA [Gammaproteobacteria bacterium]|nr:MAG: cell envelope integrity protein TolA [Gammaproteobacteria bacterium]